MHRPSKYAVRVFLSTCFASLAAGLFGCVRLVCDSLKRRLTRILQLRHGQVSLLFRSSFFFIRGSPSFSLTDRFQCSIGAITEMSTFEDEFGVLSPFIRGLTVSVRSSFFSVPSSPPLQPAYASSSQIILLPSALSGMLAGNVSDKISRKKSISLGAAIFAAGSALSAGAKGSLVMLIVARCIAGTGEGLFREFRRSSVTDRC